MRVHAVMRWKIESTVHTYTAREIVGEKSWSIPKPKIWVHNLIM